MTDREFIEHASIILHNMALENIGWRSFFRRWVISHEPLRNDAANLLRAYSLQRPMPEGTSYVGDVND